MPKPIYLDYAATTPLDKRVFKEMERYLNPKKNTFGNPSSLHFFGQKAVNFLDLARQKIAKSITANQKEIIFTSSATEANNTIIRGVVDYFYKNQRHKKKKKIPKILISAIEHPSIIETVTDLFEKKLIKYEIIPVNQEGLIYLKDLENKIDADTILVSIMWVNNETGVIQPINQVAQIVGNFREKNKSFFPLFHTDAVQAAPFFDLNVLKSGVDFMTLSSHKAYGPKGAGAFYLRLELKDGGVINPLMTGGGQEYGLRSGTENIPAIMGFARALEICSLQRGVDFKKISYFSDTIKNYLIRKFPEIEINGAEKERAPHILNIFVPYLENPALALEMEGVAVSSGSACAGRRAKESHVLKSMGFDDKRIKRSFRLSLGRSTNILEVVKFIYKMGKIIKRVNKNNN